MNILRTQMNTFFTSLPDGVIICDQAERIQQINPAALALFEIPADESYRGMPYQDFLHLYQARSPNKERVIEALDQEVGNAHQHHPPFKECLLFTLPSERDVCVNVSSADLPDEQDQAIGTVYLFHDLTDIYETASISAKANTAIFTLIKAIASIHDCIYRPSSEDNLLLPASINIVGQQMTDLISQLLKTQAVLLMSFGPPDRHIHYVAVSGLSDEQARERKEQSGRYTLTDFLDQDDIELLKANHSVYLEREKQRSPFPLFNPKAKYITWIPLFTQSQLVGILIIAKEQAYTQAEIDLINAVATLTTMIIECVKLIVGFKEGNTEEVVLQETNQIINEFLNLASHELRTPLTVTMGNIQLALRRLEKLRGQLAEHPGLLSKEIERVQNPLEYATESTRLHERMISNIVDDSRIQANELELHIKSCDLIHLVQSVTHKYQQRHPKQSIEIVIDPPATHIELMADVKRIKQVIHTYLKNAIQHSPQHHPVTIRIQPEQQQVTVFVHDDGPGVPLEDQQHIWNRFYRTKGTGLQNELDLSQGLSLYLCQALVHLHHGMVGVESNPGEGETFWFSLPLPPTEAGSETDSEAS
ncbi:hypothetical protein KDW_18540 [Dictyobacter vulcani]|uniref:histidine kinase n=1 Tax=Dictyobacter vulcani TaxID=2607529 RepID=A0A5J4KKW0_9CHLR|nr:PAS domain-containing sensor histidine kinase [Dictyobacter vulcani]GER87692.1 hypothetical protein KDW_18540 [Dictyobacter vulcani]